MTQGEEGRRQVVSGKEWGAGGEKVTEEEEMAERER